MYAGRAADVKRCYSARGALALLDFEDPSIQGVQVLMVRAAMLPPFLRSADGRKFIAHHFTLHVSSSVPGSLKPALYLCLRELGCACVYANLYVTWALDTTTVCHLPWSRCMFILVCLLM